MSLLRLCAEQTLVYTHLHSTCLVSRGQRSLTVTPNITKHKTVKEVNATRASTFYSQNENIRDDVFKDLSQQS